MNKFIGVYLRCGQYGVTKAEQQTKIESWMTTFGGPMREFVDDHSGFQRPQLERLMDDVQTGRLSLVVVPSLDRLDRICTTESDFLSFLRILSDNGVRFISIADGLDSSGEAGIFFSRLEAAISKAREIVRSERIRISLQRTREEGQQLGRPRNTDYQSILDLRKLGWSVYKIANHFEISRGAVRHCLKTSEPLDLGPGLKT